MFQGRNLWLFIGLGLLLSNFSEATPIRQLKVARDDRLIRIHIKSEPMVEVSGYGLSIDGRIEFNQHKRFKLRCSGNHKSGKVTVKSLGEFRSPLELFSDTGLIFVGGKPYRRMLRIVAEENECAVVNIVPIERYIAGVVAKEMHPEWPMEALKAQAIAARSYAIANMKRPRRPYYDVMSTTMDQVYSGAVGENSRTLLAARSTKGVVLRAKGRVLRAYYHSHCGGKTEIPKNVWGRHEPEFVSVACPYHPPKQPQTKWRYEFSKSFLQRKLRSLATVLPASFRSLANLQVSRKMNSNRVATITMADERGNSLELEASFFRRILGNRILKSTNFRVLDRDETIEFQGSGFGHGVGLCQYGTKEMANRGKDYKSILHHYYPLASLKKLY